MRNALFFLLCLFYSALYAQPVLSPTTTVTSNTSWRIHNDETPVIFFGPGTGPNGYGNMAWATLAGDPSLDWYDAQEVSPSCFAQTGQTSLPNTIPIWAPRQGCSNALPELPEVIYTRRTFLVKPAEHCAYKIRVKADNNTVIYINGQFVGTTRDNWATANGSTFDIDRFLVPNLNIVAIQAQDFGTIGWLSCELFGVCK